MQADTRMGGLLVGWLERYVLTLRHLRGQRRGDGDKIEVSASIMNGHLFALAIVFGVAIALITELLKSETTIHEHTCKPKLVSKESFRRKSKEAKR